MNTATKAKFHGRLPLAGALGLVFLATGCASKTDTKAMTATVEETHSRVVATNDFIAKAEWEINQFEKRIQNLRAEARQSASMRGKNNFESSLRQLNTELQTTRLDLRNLRAANNESWKDFRGRLNADLREMKESFGQSFVAE